MENLAGRVAVVTGAASGIGKGSALALARAGAHVVVADLDADGAELVANAARAVASDAIAVTTDVGKPDAFDVLRRLVLDRYGKIDIVMNNAGIILSGLPEDIPNAEWERVLNVNLMSVVRSVHAFLPDMLAQGEGHFVNTASFAGLYTYSFDRLPYAASKAAIIQMSEGLALYLRPKGIGVTCLCPGPVASNIMRSTKVWSQGIQIRGPGKEFDLMTADRVGELVVDAIRRDIFMLPTHPAVRDKLVRRAQDHDAFLDDQIANPQIFELPKQD